MADTAAPQTPKNFRGFVAAVVVFGFCLFVCC